jgi:ubiquinone/menaquinone biosynthesis C-methylase UbiE
MQMNVFDEMGKYWAEIAEKNQTERQISFIKNHLKPQGFVLDLACGTGRHMIALSRLGFEVAGLDISMKLLRLAKQQNRQIHLIRGDIRFLPFKINAFFAAINMDTSLGYLPTKMDDKTVLIELRKVVKDNSKVVFDLFNKDQIIRKYRSEKSKRIEYPDFFLDQKRTVSIDGEWLCDSWTVHDKTNEKKYSYSHIVRLYELQHLKKIIEEADFEVKQVFGGYEEQMFNAKADRLIIVAYAK